jgi:hypothetical protein
MAELRQCVRLLVVVLGKHHIERSRRLFTLPHFAAPSCPQGGTVRHVAHLFIWSLSLICLYGTRDMERESLSLISVGLRVC